MPYKDPKIRGIKNAEANKRWYQKNKAKHQAGTAKNRVAYRKLWAEFKETQECMFCGFDHPAALDFHHVIRTDKKSVSGLVRNGSYARAMQEIITKCIALCSNCHRILHWQETMDKKKTPKLRRRHVHGLAKAR